MHQKEVHQQNADRNLGCRNQVRSRFIALFVECKRILLWAYNISDFVYLYRDLTGR